jgi:hypothetical protein
VRLHHVEKLLYLSKFVVSPEVPARLSVKVQMNIF